MIPNRLREPHSRPLATLLIIVVLVLSVPRIAFAQDDASRGDLESFRDELVQHIRQLDLSEFSGRVLIDLHLEASHAFFEADLRKLAGDYFQQAIELAGDEQQYKFTLFDHALNIDDWETALQIASESDGDDGFLDRLAVEKYRKGDDEALDVFPHDQLTFHSALDLADAYWKRNEYEKLEAFVTSIDSLPSNEPTDVGAIIWRRIADDFRMHGEMDRAKVFIDKAMEIGGNNYYTGYGVRVAHLSIHGGLKQEAGNYAELAVAYRGHHTRELLARLISELVAAGHFDEAKETLTYYPTIEERMSGERYLAFHLARMGEIDEAMKMARAINDEAKSANARLLVAGQLLDDGQRESARPLLLESVALLTSQSNSSAEYDIRRAVRLLAQMNDGDEVIKLITAAKSPIDKGRRAAAAVEGVSLGLKAVDRDK